MKAVAQVIGGVLLVGFGMAGIHFGVEYSGWVIAGGLLLVLNA